MKRFQFKLESVLKHRIRLEDLEKKELADVFRELHEAHGVLKSLNEDFSRTQKSIEREESIKNLNIEKIVMYESYMLYCKRMTERQIIHIEQIDKRVEKKRQEFIKASKARRVIDRLKEKQYYAYMKEMDDKNQKFIDEMAIVKFIRQHSGNVH